MRGHTIASPVLLTLLVVSLLLAGCPGKASPFVGTWTRSLGRVSVTLVLNDGGTGTLSSPAQPGERAIRWREQGNDIQIEIEGATSPTGRNITGTLSEDKNTLQVTIGGASIGLQRQGQ